MLQKLGGLDNEYKDMYKNKYVHALFELVLGSMAFCILTSGIEKIPRYLVFHDILAVN